MRASALNKSGRCSFCFFISGSPFLCSGSAVRLYEHLSLHDLSRGSADREKDQKAADQHKSRHRYERPAYHFAEPERDLYKVFEKKYADADFEYYPFHDGDHCVPSDATDEYGDKITYAYFEKVLDFLEEERQKSIENGEEPYRRFEMLQNFLSTFRTDSWKEEIYVVHWGY